MHIFNIFTVEKWSRFDASSVALQSIWFDSPSKHFIFRSHKPSKYASIQLFDPFNLKMCSNWWHFSTVLTQNPVAGRAGLGATWTGSVKRF